MGDNAYNSDTRIAKFMENDKQEKAAKKQAKQDAIRERKEAEEKVLRDAEEKIRKEKEEKEKIETERKAKEKVEKEALKKGSDRDERRWIEKNNRVKRNESKKEEMKRLRKLVDNAYNSDTRIAKFMENDKQEKAAKKQAKQ